MKKNFKLVLALVLSIMMVLGSMSALADVTTNPVTNAHTIKITSNGTGTHTYEAYQVFSGNLDADEGVLSDILWGAGVDENTILGALKADNAATKDLIGDAETAADVAKVLEENKNNGSFLQAFADIVSTNLTEEKAATGNTPGGSNNFVTLNVTGDGYYFIKDVTSAANMVEGDTQSKFMLQVVRNVEVTAKDTVLTPDKNIVEGENRVKKGSSSIGDTVTFEVKIPVPDTTAYEDHFILNMFDTLPAGLTFMSVSKIEIGDLENGKLEATPDYTLVATDYKVTTSNDGTNYTEYEAPANAADAITAEGGQHIKVVFIEFKDLVEKDIDSADGVQNLQGKTIVITYTAVVNDDANFGETGNENEVEFIYSNDPNHKYTGDEPKSENEDPTGTTPESKTQTYVTTLKVVKVDASSKETDDEGKVTYSTTLAGATFTLTSTGNVLNHVLETGEKFIPATEYNGMTEDEKTVYQKVGTDNYYKLLDGSYTTTVAGSTLDDGRVVNNTQYVTPIVEYYKVKYTDVVTEAVGTTKTLTATSADDGIVEFKGLESGEYTLTETVAPDGYNALTDFITLSITWDRDGYITALNKTANDRTEAEEALIAAGGFKISSTDEDKGWSMTSNGDLYQITVENNKGVELPSTGGIGTTIFYVAGSILVLAAAILLITKRRMSAND